MDRRIGLIWEVTQAIVAILTVVANIVIVFMTGRSNDLLANAFFLVIGFYFGRINNTHPRISNGD